MLCEPGKGPERGDGLSKKKSEHLAQKKREQQQQDELSSNAPAGFSTRPKTQLRPTPKTSTSIHQAKERVVQNVEAQKQQQATSSKQLREQAYTEEDFLRAWSDFKEHPALGESPLVATILNTCEYRREGNQMVMQLSSGMQEQTFQLKLQPALLKHLRDSLQNDYIEIVSEVHQNQNGPKKVYTDEDRLQMLESDYPALKELREKLGLIIG